MWYTYKEEPSGDGGRWNDGFTHLQKSSSLAILSAAARAKAQTKLL
jgi:hypothetical protein